MAKIEDYKDKYSGRVFIIGSGPSLTVETLEKLKGEYTFATNEISKIFKETDWRPNFIAFFDKHAANIMPFFQDALDEGVIGFCSKHYEDVFTGEFVPLPHWPRGHIRYTNQNLTYGIHAFGTVMHPIAQICIWMGFTELYFVGCDLGFDKPKHHFYENAEGWYMQDDKKVEMRTKRVIIAHELIKEWCEIMGVEVYNATDGGELEVYERKDLDAVLHSTTTR
jgi:hypothetical protein